MDAGLRRRKALAATVAGVFVVFHLGALLPLWVGWSPVALGVALGLYLIRGFGITAGYHRLFAHRAYTANRVVQFLLALAGSLAVQGGLFWWVSHHRDHHAGTDTDKDVHSPVARSFWYAHMGWMVAPSSFEKPRFRLNDLAKFPELRFLQRHYLALLMLQAAALFGLGHGLALWAPELGTSGLQMLAWGLFVGTVALWHATFLVNSVGHRWGSRDHDTRDNSRNNVLVALVTLGEGWHNNHHKHPRSARAGERWFEFDPTWWALRTLGWLGLVGNFQLPAQRAAQAAAGERI